MPLTSTRLFPGTEHPLAESFLLSAGSVKVFVPDVEPRDNYIVDRESPPG